MMLKLLRNICIWMCLCSTSWLFGYVIHAVPLEYLDDHEFSYDMDTAQSKVKYDPRLLSQHLKDQHNHPQERAAPCYSATNKYTHGQRISREDPCEVCLCVDGEIFCWWKKCDNPKRRKFKLEKNPRVGKSKKEKTIDKIHKEQLHLKQKKKLERKLRRQHWQQQHQLQQQQQQHSAVHSKILTFPENLPSVLYYDYKTEDQHGFQHGNHEKPLTSTSADSGADAMGRNRAHANVNGKGTVSGSREDGDDGDDNDAGGLGDDASSAFGVAEPTSTEMKFVAKSHSTEEANKKFLLQQPSTARILTTQKTTTTSTTAEAASATGAVASEPFSSDHARPSMDNQFISGHPAGDVQMLNMASTRYTPDSSSMLPQNRTAIQDKTAFMLSQSQEIDRDGILRDGDTDGNGNKANNLQPKGGGGRTSFRSSFNDFSSEFNASAAVDLDLITGHNSAHDASIILEADSIVNASTSSSLALSSKHEEDEQIDYNNNNNSNRDNSVLSTTTMVSTSVISQEQECIVMGASYKIGAILPQETGNCLQCICIEGATKDDTPRVTCSPHNCPPLVLPDLFDATGY